MQAKLSAVIITKNESENIANALKSVQFASDILILDSGSSDNTCEIALSYGARVKKQKWLGFGPQKNKAVELAKNDWVLALDADEQITEELKEEIIKTISAPKFHAYHISRLNNFFGKNIRFGGLYPDRSIRLFNKKFCHFTSDKVHEKVLCKTQSGYLKNHMTHNAFNTIDQFVSKQKLYAGLSSKKTNYLKAFLSPIWVFIKMYILRLGFLDGWRGIVIAVVYARYTFWKYLK